MTTLAPERPRSGPPDVPDEGALAPQLRPAPARRPGDRTNGRHLRPVELRRRRNPAVPLLVAVALVIVALLALAGVHAVLIGGQIRLDELRRDVDAETEAIRRLQLRVAERESPDRILEAARDRIRMVAPEEVGYLLPAGVAGGPQDPVRMPAAEPPPPPAPTADEALAVGDAPATGDPDPDSDTDTDADPASGETTRAESTSDAPATGDPDTGDPDTGEQSPAPAPQVPHEGGRDE